MYSVRFAVNGDVIESFPTVEEAIKDMERIEIDDMKNGAFVPFAYEVYDESKHEIVQVGAHYTDITS